MTWSDGCNDGLFSWSKLLDPNRDQNNIFKFQAPVLPYMQFSHGPPFVLCYIILWSKVLAFPNLHFLVNCLMFPLWIEMFFCAPSQGAWWLAVAVHGVAARNAAVATWFLPASCWGLWLTVDTGVGFGLCHCWHLTGHLCCSRSSAPSRLRSSPLELEPWLFSHAHSRDHLPDTAAGTVLMQFCTHQRNSSRLEAFWLGCCFCQ